MIFISHRFCGNSRQILCCALVRASSTGRSRVVFCSSRKSSLGWFWPTIRRCTHFTLCFVHCWPINSRLSSRCGRSMGLASIKMVVVFRSETPPLPLTSNVLKMQPSDGGCDRTSAVCALSPCWAVYRKIISRPFSRMSRYTVYSRTETRVCFWSSLRFCLF